MRAIGSTQVMLRVLPYLRALLLLAVLAGTFALIVPVQVFLRLVSPASAGVIQSFFCRTICWVIGVKVSPKRFRAEPKAYLVVANHVSWTDIIALASVAPMTFLAKSEVSTWPLLGTLARLQGTVFIRRGDRKQISSINKGLADILRDGRKLVVFPEGTSTHGVMTPRFNSSHLEAAQLADAAVIPVAIYYTDEAGQADVGWYGDMTFLPHLWGLLKKSGIECRLLFGEPIYVRDRNRKALSAEAQEGVCDLLMEARNEHLR